MRINKISFCGVQKISNIQNDNYNNNPIKADKDNNINTESIKRGRFSNEIRLPSTCAKTTYYSSVRAQGQVKAIDKDLNELISQSINTLNETKSKLTRMGIPDSANSEYFNSTYMKNLDGSAYEHSYSEYDGERKIKNTILFNDGSMKIVDLKNNKVIYTDTDGKLASCYSGKVTSENGDITSVTEILFSDSDSIKYIKPNRTLNTNDIYIVKKDGNYLNCTLYKNASGRDFTSPDKCDYIYNTEKSNILDDTKQPTVFLKGVRKTKNSEYSGKDALFYSFDGIDGIRKTRRIINDEPVSYHKGFVGKFDENFCLKSVKKSEYNMLYKDGKFEIMY